MILDEKLFKKEWFSRIIKIFKMKHFFLIFYLSGSLLYQDMHGSIKKDGLGPVTVFFLLLRRPVLELYNNLWGLWTE